MTDLKTYYSPEMGELLKKQTLMSEETWHKIMNPFCGQCLIERYLHQREDGMWELKKVTRDS